MSCLNVESPTKISEFNKSHRKGIWFVFFYAKWCGHCTSMHDDWNNLTNNNIHKVNLAKVEAEHIPQVEPAPPVQGYPSLVLYKNGKVEGIHQGERNVDSFNNYIRDNVTDEELANNSGIDSLNNNNNLVIELKKHKKKSSGKKNKSTKKKKPSSNSKNNANSYTTSKKPNKKSTKKKKAKSSLKKGATAKKKANKLVKKSAKKNNRANNNNL